MSAQRPLIAVYIVASQRNGTLYVGVTSDLYTRVWEHKTGALPGFTETYGCKTLVWFQPYEEVTSAIRREKSLKRWRRAWKLALIEAENPDWRDLSDGWYPDTTWDFEGRGEAPPGMKPWDDPSPPPFGSSSWGQAE